MKRSKRGLNEGGHDLRQLIDAKLDEIKRELLGVLARYSGAVNPASRRRAKVKRRKARARAGSSAPRQALLTALRRHPRRRELLRAGKARDQLLRSLIPLYLARGLKDVEVNSGAISAFWKANGVSFAGPNAAKALREHVGYAVDKRGGGKAITPNGIKYVEAALGRRAAA